ncbi:MAG: hypothetical protein ABSE48_04630 [Verrucomicrobiota bacterium]
MRPSLFPMVLLLAVGCATAPPLRSHFSRPPHLFPADGFITQRAVLSVHGRQFPLNGYLALSAAGGKRLVVTENFGHVVADVLVKPEGTIFVMKSSPMFPSKYIRRGLADDLQCLFGDATNQDCPVEMPEADHFILKRRAYSLDLRILEVKSGPQPADLFDAAKAEIK